MLINSELAGLLLGFGVPMIGVIVWLAKLGAKVEQNDKDHIEIKAAILDMTGKLDRVLEKTALLQFCPLNNPDCPIIITKKD